MRRSFTLPIKGFSINSAYYRDRAIKTRECRDWETQFLWAISAPGIQKSLQELREYFDPDKHSYSIRICAYYPDSQFFNAKGHVSARTFDLSNTEKIFCDALFSEATAANSGLPVKNLAANDTHIVRLHSYKLPGPAHCIKVDIKIISKPGRHDP